MRSGKSSGVVAALSLNVLLLGFLFKTRHWPGAGWLIIIPQIGILIAGILILLDSFHETDKGKQSIKTPLADSWLVFRAIMVYY